MGFEAVDGVWLRRFGRWLRVQVPVAASRAQSFPTGNCEIGH